MRSFLPGKALPDGVVSQIQKRQDVLGLTGTRLGDVTGPSSYAYYNQKTPWIRVISSVNPPGDSSGDQARTNILSNGVLENHNLNTPAGYEISPTLGPRPKPGITSMDLRTHNRFGSLRTATVNFTVFSIEDLNIYERLYMSPGYTALLEWGHSKALTPDGEVEDVQPLDLEEVFQEGLTMSRVFAKIQEHRKRYSYNYDASFGLVKNFSWSLSSDGSYECSMDIVSIGTAFESMNISAGILTRDVQEFLKENPLTSEEASPVTIIQEEDSLGNLYGLFDFENTVLPGKTQEQIGEIEQAAILYRNLLGLSDNQLSVDIVDNTEDVKLKNGAATAPTANQIFQSYVDPIARRSDNREIVARRLRTLTEQKSRLDVMLDASVEGLAFTIASSFRETRLIYKENGTRDQEDEKGIDHLEEDLDTLIPSYLKNEDGDYKTITLTNGQQAQIVGPTADDITKLKVPAIATGFNYYVYILPFILEVQEAEETAAADIQQQEENQANLDQIFNIIRKYHPELRSRIHFFINQFLLEAKDTKPPTASVNFYKEFESSYLLNNFSNREDNQASQTLALYSTTALKYITVDTVGESTEEGKENRPDLNYNYIQFGAFLEILNYFIPRDQNKVPLFSFDTSVQQVEGEVVRDFRTLDNYHCSVDVSKCLLPRTETPDPFIGPTLQGTSNNQKRPVNSIYGILLEKQYLYGVLNDNMVKGELKFYDILQTILEDIVRVTGRVNDLQLQYYENFRTFRIVDRNFTDVEEEYPSISIFGKNSFTKQVNLASRLTPEISTMLAIAAQNKPTSNGIQGTAFKEFNKNQTDRIIEIRQDPDSSERDLSELQEQFASVFQYLFIVYGKDQNRIDVGEFAESLQKLGLLPPNVISDYVDFCNYQIYGESLGEEPKANNFIIPYELNLTVDGISGLEVMSAFVTDDTLIPDRYKGNGGIGFLITGLQHKVTPQGWDTTINSQIFNLDRGKRKSNEGIFKLEEPTPIVSDSIRPFTGPSPNADRLRQTLTSLNYAEKRKTEYPQGEISSGGDLDSTFANTLIKFFTEMKSNLSSDLTYVEITGGNDVYHQKKQSGLHPQGRALDFVIEPYNLENSSKIEKIAEKYGLNFLDEYQKRTANQTGAHIHIYG